MSTADLYSSEPEIATKRRLTIPAWALFGACLFAIILLTGNRTLLDVDTYWHIAVGQSIIAHHALPYVDTYSFTKTGQPWISSSWLSQVIFAQAYALAGWTGPVVLTASAIASTFAALVWIMSKRFAPMHAVFVGASAALISMGHFLARPHILVLPVMLAWAWTLVSASDHKRAPSFWALPLMVLWANLHGSFVLGIVLVAPFGLDALWNAEAAERRSLAVRWAAFAVATVAAACLTPYGWNSILAAQKILSLGDAMSLIPEWQPVNFAQPKFFELSVLVCVAAILMSGIKLSPPRILLVAGFLYMALSHVRNIEVFAVFVPLLVAKPLAEQWHVAPSPQMRPSRSGVALLVLLLGVFVFTIGSSWRFTPAPDWTPSAAIQFLKDHKAKRILNSPGFGGYLITQGVPTFVDGRAELYGAPYIVDAFRGLPLKNVDVFLGLLDKYQIDATLLSPSTPAASLLDRLPGWKRVYADDKAVIHMRDDVRRAADSSNLIR
jgi:hypothetical protein